jgi:hypothetical protein
MKKIIISIPDNLTPLQEAAAIAKKMTQKALSGSSMNKGRARIGTEIKIKDLETEIVIKRVSSEPIIEMVECPVCNGEYQNNTAKFYYTNYGGNVRKKPVCSDICVNAMCDAFPGRISANKTALKAVRLF